MEVTVGRLDAVVPETLRFLFDAIKTERGFGSAALSLIEEPVECWCRICSAEFSLDEPVFICPYCGSTRVTVIKGRGVTLTRIEAEVEDESTQYQTGD